MVANPARGQLNNREKSSEGLGAFRFFFKQGKIIFPRPRSRPRIWSRETGSAVPSRVSLLIAILRLNVVLTYGNPPEFRGGVHLFINHLKPP